MYDRRHAPFSDRIEPHVQRYAPGSGEGGPSPWVLVHTGRRRGPPARPTASASTPLALEGTPPGVSLGSGG